MTRLLLGATFLAILCALLPGCPHKGPCDARWSFASQSHYSVIADHHTPGGVAYDPSGLPINPARIDRLVGEVEACLARKFPGGVLPQANKDRGSCQAASFPLPTNRCAFAIKIDANWRMSCEGSWGRQQLLPGASAPGYVCAAKGLLPSPECPCLYRVAIQDDRVIVAPPSMYLLKDGLVRMISGCRLVWSDPDLAECALPSTAPLDDGTGP